MSNIKPPSKNIKKTEILTETITEFKDNEIKETKKVITKGPRSPYTPSNSKIEVSKNPKSNTVEIISEVKAPSYDTVINNLDNELLKLGYQSVGKIVIRKNGQLQTDYVKAINQRGQKLYILVDEPGFNPISKQDITVMELNSAGNVPYSLKNGTFNHAGIEVLGVAFECGLDSICTLIRDEPELPPIENNYTFVNAVNNVDHSLIAYPIVKLSEIRADKDTILDHVDCVTRRLRKAAYNTELNALKVAQISLERLENSLNAFSCLRDKTVININKTLAELNELNDCYLSNPPQDDDNRESFRKVYQNLIKRNEAISTLLRCMHKVAHKFVLLDELSAEIDGITMHCEEEFKNIEFDMC
jgi:hypothetical protein